MAGRAKVGGDVTPVRFADGVLARIDAVAGKGRRAEFIREAVDRALLPACVEERSGISPDVSAMRRALNPIEAVPRPPSVSSASVTIEGNAASTVLARRRVLAAAEQERSDKMKLLLEAVRRRAMTARDASLELGWPEILTAKVADKLFAAGLVHFPRGAGVMEVK